MGNTGIYLARAYLRGPSKFRVMIDYKQLLKRVEGRHLLDVGRISLPHIEKEIPEASQILKEHFEKLDEVLKPRGVLRVQMPLVLMGICETLERFSSERLDNGLQAVRTLLGVPPSSHVVSFGARTVFPRSVPASDKARLRELAAAILQGYRVRAPHEVSERYRNEAAAFAQIAVSDYEVSLNELNYRYGHWQAGRSESVNMSLLRKSLGYSEKIMVELTSAISCADRDYPDLFKKLHEVARGRVVAVHRLWGS